MGLVEAESRPMGTSGAPSRLGGDRLLGSLAGRAYLAGIANLEAKTARFNRGASRVDRFLLGLSPGSPEQARYARGARNPWASSAYRISASATSSGWALATYVRMMSTTSPASSVSFRRSRSALSIAPAATCVEAIQSSIPFQ